MSSGYNFTKKPLKMSSNVKFLRFFTNYTFYIYTFGKCKIFTK